MDNYQKAKSSVFTSHVRKENLNFHHKFSAKTARFATNEASSDRVPCPNRAFQFDLINSPVLEAI